MTFEPKEVVFSHIVLWFLAVIQYADPECSWLRWLVGTKTLSLVMEGAVHVSNATVRPVRWGEVAYRASAMAEETNVIFG